jgi:hypothetical protein
MITAGEGRGGRCGAAPTHHDGPADEEVAALAHLFGRPPPFTTHTNPAHNLMRAWCVVGGTLSPAPRGPRRREQRHDY